MKILYRKQFKKLREEYADLGDVKLKIIEDKVHHSVTIDRSILSDVTWNGSLDNVDLSRSVEYYVKYRELVNKRNIARTCIFGGGLAGLLGFAIKKSADTSKTNHTLQEEYYKGRSEQSQDWIDIAVEHNGEDAWLADTPDGQHVYIKVSDEETEEYKELYKDCDW